MLVGDIKKHISDGRARKSFGLYSTNELVVGQSSTADAFQLAKGLEESQCLSYLLEGQEGEPVGCLASLQSLGI